MVISTLFQPMELRRYEHVRVKDGGNVLQEKDEYEDDEDIEFFFQVIR